MKILPWEQGEKDLQILKDLATMLIQDVHAKYYPNVNPTLAQIRFNARFWGIRRRLARYRWFVNNVNNLMKKSSYANKRLRVVVENPEKMTI